MKKVWIGIALVIVLIAAVWAEPTLATSSGESGEGRVIVKSGTCGDNLTWTLDDEGLLVIEGEGEMEDYSLISPPGSGFYCTSAPWSWEAKYIVLAEGVTSIGANAFYGAMGAPISVTLPDSITSIGKNAIISDLIYANPDSDAARALSKAGYSFRTPGINYEIHYINTGTEKESLELSSVDYDVISFTVPNGITNIGIFAFSSCSRLSSVSIPDSVTCIGGSAFSGCSALTGISIPDGVTSIGNYAFSGCTGLTSISIPDGVTIINPYTFSGCTGLTSISIPDGVTSIGNYAFSGCTGLTSITIPDSVTSINYDAFYRCTSLTDITCPMNAPLMDATFSTTPTIHCYPNSEAEAWAISKGFPVVYLEGTPYKAIITLPANLTRIESEAFADLPRPALVVIPTAASIDIAPDAFAGSGVTIECPAGSPTEAWALANGIPTVNP